MRSLQMIITFMKTLTARDSYNHDQNKKQMAERCGFKVITAWSDISPKENLEIIKREMNI